MSGSFTFYEDTDGNWIPIGKNSASGNGDVVITNDTTMYITEMQKSGVFVGANYILVTLHRKNLTGSKIQNMTLTISITLWKV